MLTQEQIENKNFTLYQDISASETVEVPYKEYLVEGTRTHETTERVSVISLIYFEENNGQSLMKITNWFNQPLFYKEYFFIGDIKTEAELDTALERIDFELKAIDLNKLHEYK